MSAGFSAEPKLLSKKEIELPPHFIKKRLNGSVIMSIDIDSKGNIERCLLKKGLNPDLDSLVKNSILRSVYSPAFESGRAVPSMVELEVPFNSDSLVYTNTDVVPDFDGYILEKGTNIPITNAIVNIEYNDSLSDTSIVNGFNSYLQLIGNCKGQQYIKGYLSAKTDSSGYFAFKYLPDGKITIAILAQHFDIAHFAELVKSGAKKTVKYYIEPYKKEIDSSCEIVVFGKDSSNSEIVFVENEQNSAGLTHYLSKILLTKATIRQVPEAASGLLVRSGSTYDNRYLIAGVPFLSPYHFGGCPFGDMDGVMLSAVNEINVNVDRVAGKMPDVTGALIEANPGIYRPSPVKLKQRKELSVDFSTMSQDFLLSFPGKNNNVLQLGFTRSEDYTLKWAKIFYNNDNSADYNVGDPLTFGNATLTANVTTNKIKSEIFGWFAYDVYDIWNEPRKIFPWGMGSVKIHPSKNEKFTLIAGGSHQYFAEGKRVFANSFLKTNTLTNGIITASYDRIQTKVFDLYIKTTVQYDQWQGQLKQRDSSGKDTAIYQSGKESYCAVNSTLSRRLGLFEIAANVLLDGIIYENSFKYIVDAGVSLSFDNDFWKVSLNGGKVTGRPDIRGLPDRAYRQEMYPTYLLSAPIQFRKTEKLNTTFQPYLRYIKDAPTMDPLYLTWQPGKKKSALAYGFDYDISSKLNKRFEMNAVLNVAHAHRGHNHDSIYEWAIPITIRGRAHVQFAHDMLHLYVDGIRSAGIPYYDFKEMKYKSLPAYKSVDLSLQFRSKALDYRIMSRYDAYFVVKNLLNTANIRTYWWDTQMRKRRILLNPGPDVEIGLRLGLRL
jgi:hypothetical protein